MKFFDSTKTVGLELKDNKIKAVELHKKGSKINVANSGEQELSVGIIENGKVRDCNKLAKELVKFWSNNSFGSKEVYLGISNQDVLVRLAPFPKINHKKLDSAVKLQAQNMLPVNISQLVLDYTVIGETYNEDGNPLWEILIVAGKKDMIYDYISCLEKAELFINEIEVLPLSMGRLLEKEQQEQVVVMIDSNGGVINLSVFENGNPKLARMITPPNSGAELEEDKINLIVTNTTTLIDYYQTQSTVNTVDAIVICGGAENNQKIMNRLQNDLGVPVYFSNPQSTMDLETLGLASEELKNYSQVISLAYKGLEEN